MCAYRIFVYCFSILMVGNFFATIHFIQHCIAIVHILIVAWNICDTVAISRVFCSYSVRYNLNCIHIFLKKTSIFVEFFVWIPFLIMNSHFLQDMNLNIKVHKLKFRIIIIIINVLCVILCAMKISNFSIFHFDSFSVFFFKKTFFISGRAQRW